VQKGECVHLPRFTVACPLNSNKDMSQFESPQSEPTCIYQRTRSPVRLHCFLHTPCLSPRFAIPAHGYLRTAYYVLTTYCTWPHLPSQSEAAPTLENRYQPESSYPRRLHLTPLLSGQRFMEGPTPLAVTVWSQRNLSKNSSVP
jgi:hypothetical protein